MWKFWKADRVVLLLLACAVHDNYVNFFVTWMFVEVYKVGLLSNNSHLRSKQTKKSKATSFFSWNFQNRLETKKVALCKLLFTCSSLQQQQHFLSTIWFPPPICPAINFSTSTQGFAFLEFRLEIVVGGCCFWCCCCLLSLKGGGCVFLCVFVCFLSCVRERRIYCQRENKQPNSMIVRTSLGTTAGLPLLRCWGSNSYCPRWHHHR